MIFSWWSFLVKKLIILTTFLWSTFCWSKTIVLLGQWHLVAKQNTLDIEKSKELPQYPNQKAIYLILKEWIEKGSLNTVLAEGCEGKEINSTYPETFQGWNYKNLTAISNDKEYDDITTHVPLKLEAKYKDKVLTVCADKMDLINKHQLVFSDLRGYTGFYSRFYRHKDDKKVSEKFHKTLEQLEKTNIKDPLAYTKQKIATLIDQEEQLLLQRNQNFLLQIEKTKAEKLALVIGQRHVQNLKEILQKNGHHVIIPELLQATLPQTDLTTQFKQLIQSK